MTCRNDPRNSEVSHVNTGCEWSTYFQGTLPKSSLYLHLKISNFIRHVRDEMQYFFTKYYFKKELLDVNIEFSGELSRSLVKCEEY